MHSGKSPGLYCCYCENERDLTVANANFNACTLTIKLPIGDSEFSFVLETIVFRLNLSLNSLCCCIFL